MMSTYELVIAFLSTDSSIQSSTEERKKVSLDPVDSEMNVVNDSEL